MSYYLQPFTCIHKNRASHFCSRCASAFCSGCTDKMPSQLNSRQAAAAAHQNGKDADMKKRLLVFLISLSMLSGGVVYADEDNRSGEEYSEQKEDKEEKEDKEDKEDKEESEGSGQTDDSQGESHEGAADSAIADSGSGENSAADPGSEESTGDGSAEQTDAGRETEAPEGGAAVDESLMPGGDAAADESTSLQDGGTDQDTGGEELSPAASDETADTQGDALTDEITFDDGSLMEEVGDTEAYSAEDAFAGEYGDIPVITKLVEDGSVPEGTVLREYPDVDENGNPVIVQEVATAPVEEAVGEEDFDLLDHFGLAASMSQEAPTIDNGGWSDLPSSWEYNWDNSDNATKWGMWGGNGNLQGYVAGSIEDLNVRHRMQMYCDGENVHLMITYASCFDNAGNGDDYNFYIDGERVKFKVTYDDGKQLTQDRKPGTYTLRIEHEDDSISSKEVMGGTGEMIVHAGQLNNVTEITIPVSEMVRQNPNINPDTFSMIEFFTPNLMYRRIATSGASAGTVPFVLITFVFFTGAYYIGTRRRELKLIPAFTGC